MKRTILLALILVSVAGCQRHTSQQARIGEPVDAPKYTVELSKNKPVQNPK